jgi:neutral ceramidase
MRFGPGVLLGVAVTASLIAFAVLSPQRHETSQEQKFRRGAAGSGLQIGAGIHDATGPAANVNLMGYAQPKQTASGIHIRLRSRAFVFVDGSSSKRVAFVSFDGGMASDLVKKKVLSQLDEKYPGVYTNDNVCISGTHTHSAPAGFLQYVLFQVTSLGYVEQAADAFVDGIAQSIIKAHENVQSGRVLYTEGLLSDANINRSPTSYMANPAEERARYLSVGNDTDHTMVMLKLETEGGDPIGMLNWYAVHGTSMNNTNGLLSGDNKGYAGYLVEKQMNPGQLAGKGKFVAAFAQTNLGDVSPNTRGPHCLDTGLPCDVATSTCNGKNELCVASGPGRDMFESTQIIGQRQVDKALELFSNAKSDIGTTVDYIHQFVHMPSLEVNGTTLCSPAMGYAFAAGTTDGPGAFDFKQGTTTGNPFWDTISHILAKPSAETEACHKPKQILLDTGDISKPYDWDPHTVPVQILRVGRLFILAVPAELTTMSGRRLRNAVKDTLIARGVIDQDGIVVIAGLSNSYASYVATFEEYQKQRYEAGSTLYGPHTLQGYISKFTELADAMARGQRVDPGPSPPDLESSQLSFLPGVIVDGTEFGKDFGDVITDVKSSYTTGSRVSVVFQSACPRNDLRTEDTFLAVQQQDSSGQWQTVAVDGDWETRFRWYRHHTISDRSYAEITWDIPSDATPGKYRIQHYGNHRNILQHISSFRGTSSTFTVTAARLN